MAVCRAKDPSSCRVHGLPVVSVEELQIRADAAFARGDGAEYLAVRSQMSEMARPVVTDAVVSDVVSAIVGEEDESGEASNLLSGPVRSSLEAAVSHIRYDGAPDRFAAEVFARQLWSLSYAPLESEDGIRMGWDSASPSSRRFLMHQGAVAVTILRKHLS